MAGTDVPEWALRAERDLIKYLEGEVAKRAPQLSPAMRSQVAREVRDKLLAQAERDLIEGQR